MSEKRNNNEDRVVPRITEDEIKKKLYGQFPRDEKKKKAFKVRGEKPENKVPDEKDSPEEKVLEEKTPPKPAAPQATPVDNVRGEIRSLKDSLSELEEKLKKSEDQKEKLKVRLAQKIKVLGIKERLLDVVFNKLPEKMLLLIVGLIVLMLLILAVRHKPKPSAAPQSPVAPVSEVQPQENVPVETEPALETGAKQYTIQVAEYADTASADAFVKKLKDQNFDVHIDTSYRGQDLGKPYFKISVGSFSTVQEAKDYMPVIRKKLNIRDSFIKERK